MLSPGASAGTAGPAATAFGGAAVDADAVWLCEPESGATALCVRPRNGRVMVRRVAMTTPLSAADAAALALSVEVAFMRDESAPSPRGGAPAATLAASASPSSDAAAGHTLTLALSGGAGASASGPRLRAGVEAVYAPSLWGRRLGLGLGLTGGPTVATTSSARGPGPAAVRGTESDIALGLFARGALRLSRLWLQLDLGPAGHLFTQELPDLLAGDTIHRRLRPSVDGAIGAVVPFGRFFGGLRFRASYLVSASPLRADPVRGPWGGEGLFTLGAGFL